MIAMDMIDVAPYAIGSAVNIDLKGDFPGQVIVFPVSRAKVIMMSASGERGKPTAGSRPAESTETEAAGLPGMLGTLAWLFRTQGAMGLYQGLGPDLARGVLSAALMLMIKERLAFRVQRLLG